MPTLFSLSTLTLVYSTAFEFVFLYNIYDLAYFIISIFGFLKLSPLPLECKVHESKIFCLSRSLF